MNKKATNRINEIDATIKLLRKRLMQGSCSSTEKATIAVDIRNLITEKSNILRKLNPIYDTVKTMSTLSMKGRFLISIIQKIVFGKRSIKN